MDGRTAGRQVRPRPYLQPQWLTAAYLRNGGQDSSDCMMTFWKHVLPWFTSPLPHVRTPHVSQSVANRRVYSQDAPLLHLVGRCRHLQALERALHGHVERHGLLGRRRRGRRLCSTTGHGRRPGSELGAAGGGRTQRLGPRPAHVRLALGRLLLGRCASRHGHRRGHGRGHGQGHGSISGRRDKARRLQLQAGRYLGAALAASRRWRSRRR